MAIVVNEGGLPEAAALPNGLVLRSHIPQGHKVALSNISKGGEIRRYNTVIGLAAVTIRLGDLVNESNMHLPEAPAPDALQVGTALEPLLSACEAVKFQGYRNPDGTVGTRNLLAITTTVHCVSGVVDHAARRIRDELLPHYPNVDGVVALDHIYGCGVAIDAPGAEIPIRTLRNISANPNFGGEVLTVSLGCEKLQPDRLFSDLPIFDLVVLQEEPGFEAMIRAIMTRAKAQLDRLNRRQRETCPASALTVGMQCGGSDAFSGVTANPALGYASDLLVGAGATVMFSENTEVRDGIAHLLSRAASPDIGAALIRELTWYDDYLARGGVDRSANTTPGNKAGGLSTIVEKAMGSIAKSGTAPISGVVPPGDKARDPGLNYAATPASDFVCGTLQLAAGATVHCFTTGRGTPYSLEALPTIKISSRSTLKCRWPDLIDVDAGTIAEGEESVEQTGMRIFDEILDVASGKKTMAERLGIHNTLALYNPAPIT